MRGTSGSLFLPDRRVRSVCDVSPEELIERFGIRGVVIDLDNTLTEWRSEAVSDAVMAWLARMHRADIGMCIASNTHNMPRLARVAAHCGAKYVPADAGKPGARGLRIAMSLLETNPTETAMIGDQLFTDILGGNRLRLYTILVNPLSPYEFIGTQLISRRLEALVLRGENARPG